MKTLLIVLMFCPLFASSQIKCDTMVYCDTTLIPCWIEVFDSYSVLTWNIGNGQMCTMSGWIKGYYYIKEIGITTINNDQLIYYYDNRRKPLSKSLTVLRYINR
jgi:hypothetical protein